MAYSSNGTEEIKKAEKWTMLRLLAGKKKSKGNLRQVGGPPLKDNHRRLPTKKRLTRIHQDVKWKLGC